jgi:hypothetical protein
MSNAEAFAVILSGTIPALVALAGLLWWAYKRGEAAGEARAERRASERSQAEDKARITDLERQLAETRAELFSLAPPKRKHWTMNSFPLF